MAVATAGQLHSSHVLALNADLDRCAALPGPLAEIV